MAIKMPAVPVGNPPPCRVSVVFSHRFDFGCIAIKASWCLDPLESLWHHLISGLHGDQKTCGFRGKSFAPSPVEGFSSVLVAGCMAIKSPTMSVREPFSVASQPFFRAIIFVWVAWR